MLNLYDALDNAEGPDATRIALVDLLVHFGDDGPEAPFAEGLRGAVADALDHARYQLIEAMHADVGWGPFAHPNGCPWLFGARATLRTLKQVDLIPIRRIGMDTIVWHDGQRLRLHDDDVVGVERLGAQSLPSGIDWQSEHAPSLLAHLAAYEQRQQLCEGLSHAQKHLLDGDYVEAAQRTGEVLACMPALPADLRLALHEWAVGRAA